MWKMGCELGGVSSKDNTSDILTKFLQADLHHIHTNQLHPTRPVPIPYNRQTPPTLTPPVDTNTSSSHDDPTPSHRTHLHNLVTRLSHLNLNGRLPGNVKDTHHTHHPTETGLIAQDRQPRHTPRKFPTTIPNKQWTKQRICNPLHIFSPDTIYETPCLHRQNLSHSHTKPTNRRRKMFCNSIKTPPTSFNKPTRNKPRLHTRHPGPPQPTRKQKGESHSPWKRNHVCESHPPMKTQEIFSQTQNRHFDWDN